MLGCLVFTLLPVAFAMIGGAIGGLLGAGIGLLLALVAIAAIMIWAEMSD